MAELDSCRSAAVFLAAAFAYCATSVGFAGWEREASGTSSSLQSVVFKNKRQGWAAGSSGGTIIHTSDGGATWAVQFSNTPVNLSGIDFGDTLVGVAVGDTPYYVSASYGVHTTDGGNTWGNSLGRDIQYDWLTDCRLVSPTCGWIIGGLVDDNNYYVADFAYSWPGATREFWQENGTFHDVDATDSLTVWVVGHDQSYVGEVLKTTNGGDSWAVVSTGLGRHVWACDFIDSEQGWVLGHDGAVFHTTDGGFSWVTQVDDTPQVFNGIAFADSSNGWVVGNGGLILRTRDGGTSWATESSGTATKLNAVSVLDNTLSAWAVGDGGTILHYEPGAGVSGPTARRPQALTGLKVEPGIGRSSFRFSVQSGGAEVRWRVRDATGREVWFRDVPGGGVGTTWSACDQSGKQCPAGAYFVQAECGAQRLVGRLLLVR